MSKGAGEVIAMQVEPIKRPRSLESGMPSIRVMRSWLEGRLEPMSHPIRACRHSGKHSASKKWRMSPLPYH
jgi:hypothetical protein